MARYLQNLSGVLFYVLGISFFAAYLLELNQVITWGFWWMKVADVPLALVAIIYGGTSTYLSIRPNDNKPAIGIAWTIGIVLTCVLVAVVVMNFWNILPVT